MILIVSVQQPQKDSSVNPRFGRSPFFVKWDSETKEWEGLTNPGAEQSGGAGITAAQFIVDQKAAIAVSGDFGPNAARVLESGGVRMIRFPEGVKTLEDVIKLFESGELK